ncbi:MAG TPA: hypothetical protein VN698_14395 [Bacteroidia bacterium]|nr:hypothetical protein [Bacteroidia bacterium]
MPTDNKLQMRYSKKLALYFAQDWILLSISIILFVYFLVNYFFNNSYELFNIPWNKALIIDIVPSTIFIVKYFISIKLKARLITEIIEDSKYYALIVYNKALIRVDRASIPLERIRKSDFFVTVLFESRFTTIYFEGQRAEKFIVKINNKKYYLIPRLFDSEVLI